MRLLVIEDAAPLRESLREGLSESGYAVDASANGPDGLRLALSGEYDVILLDLMLPGIDGMDILRTLRKRKSPSCILVLTARDARQDRIRGLDGGADDYLVKPFDFDELLARVRALLRRKYDVSPLLQIHDLTVNTVTRELKRAGQPIYLSAREFALLNYLAHNPNRFVTQEDLWQHVYDMNATLESNVVAVHIASLRRKIERPGSPRLIHSRRGQGYLLGDLPT
ncbi:MAG TPA: response regulator transcription factor [Phycisphaerae bacterium]|nr:response regulator transcription factor [Phycisphaerae bacterium]